MGGSKSTPICARPWCTRFDDEAKDDVDNDAADDDDDEVADEDVKRVMPIPSPSSAKPDDPRSSFLEPNSKVRLDIVIGAKKLLKSGLYMSHSRVCVSILPVYCCSQHHYAK
jgi:hypothetical protein